MAEPIRIAEESFPPAASAERIPTATGSAIPMAETPAVDEFTPLFRSHVQEAVRQTRRILLNSDDEGMVLKAAESILDRAGATRKVERSAKPVINISDSNVQLLLQATKEGL